MSLDWKAKSSGGSLIYLVSTTSLHWRLTYAPKTVEAFVLADILKGCSENGSPIYWATCYWYVSVRPAISESPWVYRLESAASAVNIVKGKG